VFLKEAAVTRDAYRDRLMGMDPDALAVELLTQARLSIRERGRHLWWELAWATAANMGFAHLADAAALQARQERDRQAEANRERAGALGAREATSGQVSRS
jgi:hypothetical protein